MQAAAQQTLGAATRPCLRSRLRGCTKDSLPVCGQTVQGTTLRKALGLRSACFTVVCQSGTFSFTTRGYGHGVGMSQWGAKALAEQGADYRAILAHYYPGTELRR